MNDRIFLYRIKDTYDRDACAYIENKPRWFVCGHYFGGVNLQGSCYSGGEFASYEDVETILSETEYNALMKFSDDIDDLGYGIEEGDDRYNKGVELCKAIQPVYDKLNSKEAEKFFAEIMESEKEILRDLQPLSDDDVDEIFKEYFLEYRDRSIVLHVYDDLYDLGYEEARVLGYVDENSPLENFIDYEGFGESLIDGEMYVKLASGHIVYLAC